MELQKVIIIGSGPAGYSAAIYLSRASLSPLMIAGDTPGGQLTQTSEVENYPGYESILGIELTNKWKNHALKFGTKIINGTVVRLSKKNNHIEIILSSGEIFESESALITTGASALWLGIESETKFRGKGVSACATCDGFFFKNKTVAVVGGGDTALEEALFLTKFAQKIYIIHRRSEFRGSKIMQQRVFNNSKITVLWESQVEEILGNQRVSGIKIITNNEKTIEQLSNRSILKTDGVFIAIGHKPNTEFLKDAGVLLDKKGYIITSNRYTNEFAKFKIQNSKFKMTIQNLKLEEIVDKFDLNYQYITSVSRIFAAGDCVDYQYRQAATAVGTGVAAALEMEEYLEDK